MSRRNKRPPALSSFALMFGFLCVLEKSACGTCGKAKTRACEDCFLFGIDTLLNRVRTRMKILSEGNTDRNEAETKVICLALSRLSERTFSLNDATVIFGTRKRANAMLSKLRLSGHISSCDMEGQTFAMTPMGTMFVAMHSETFTGSPINGNGTKQEIN